MISVTKLLFATDYFGDSLRYTKNARDAKNGVHEGAGPVVVWNSTKTCNLKCMHCYMKSDARKYQDELSTAEAKKFIDDLAAFHVPVLLFSQTLLFSSHIGSRSKFLTTRCIRERSVAWLIGAFALSSVRS